jgi:hypothetical protein
MVGKKEIEHFLIIILEESGIFEDDMAGISISSKITEFLEKRHKISGKFSKIFKEFSLYSDFFSDFVKLFTKASKVSKRF